MASMSYCQWENAQQNFCQSVEAFDEEGQSLIDELVDGYETGYPHEYRAFIALRELAENFIRMCDNYDIPDINDLKVDEG